jgi:mRNA-degrading endonuclease RelE of RelBE toxin-antitoxin system
MSERLQFSPRAVKDLRRLARRMQEAVLSDLEHLAASAQFPPPPKFKKLKGHPDLYRLRTGEHRTVCRISAAKISVLRVLDRKDLERILSQLWG